MNRPQNESASSPATVEQVVEVALKSFSVGGFVDTKLEAIATESGMTKRMIHYHFGDKKGLYMQALLLAVSKLRPSAAALEIDTAVPVDGVSQIVEVLYAQMITNPEACRLVVMENLFHWAELDQASPIADQSNVLLALDRLLMLGQDSGAFRPGISALDVYTSIAALCAFRVSNRDTFVNLYGADLHDEHNTKGLKRLAVDMVLSFLTSNMSSEGMSYLVDDYPSRFADIEDDTSLTGIYGDQDFNAPIEG